jgi:bifunctional UDP-N-acetylglucosamine pyrophosphorylase/glucosamine-1-phosphate N-acetyltransferase
MRSTRPKVLHEIGGRSLLGHAMGAAAGLHPEQLVVVVGHGADEVRTAALAAVPSARVAVQQQRRGTGHAVGVGLDELGSLRGEVVVTYADVPLLTTATLEGLLAEHRRTGAAVTLLTAHPADPTGYGRIVRDADGTVAAIVEHRDADEATLAVREVNSGIAVYDAAVLLDALGRVSPANAQGELYLTDVVGIARADGAQVAAVAGDDPWQTEGVNDRVQLAELGRELNRRVVEAWMRAGVTVVDPATTWVDVGVTLAADVTLLPGTQLRGTTVVADGALVGPDSTLVDATVGQGAQVVRSHVLGATIGPDTVVGPFSYLRPGTVLDATAKVGAFVEIKASRVGEGSKVPHLSYVGDADIGRFSNVGAATVVVNYDGERKHRTVVGDHVRIGSDTMLVAPVTVGDGAYTAAGSVVVDDVPPGAMAVARSRQRTIVGWVARRRAGSPADQAARAATLATADGAAAPPHGGHPAADERTPT